MPSSKVSVQQASDLVTSVSAREQRHIDIVGGFLDGEVARVLPIMHEHLAEYPRDGLIVHLASMTIAGGGRITRSQEAYDLLASIAPAWGDDWWFLGALSNRSAGKRH